MSYIEREEWVIIPEQPPGIIRNCSGCKKKSVFRSSGNFRINANGNKMDVWLIYRCETCDTSWNMDIYTRVASGTLEKRMYDRFLANDWDTALEYGCRKEILSQNKADALWEQAHFKVEKTTSKAWCEEDEESAGRIIAIFNQYGLPLRLDKLLSSELGRSRKEINRMEDSGLLRVLTGGKNAGSRIPAFMEVKISGPFLQDNERAAPFLA